jgi:hypothetical protein
MRRPSRSGSISRTAMSRPIDFVSTPALLVLLLSLGLIVQLALPIPAPIPPRPMRHTAPLLTSLPLEPAPATPALLARPIFNPDRTGSPAGADANAVTLVGIASTGARAAIVLRDGDGGDHVIQLGEAYGPWRLAQAADDGATFQRGGDSVTLRVGASVVLPPNATPAGAKP